MDWLGSVGMNRLVCARLDWAGRAQLGSPGLGWAFLSWAVLGLAELVWLGLARPKNKFRGGLLQLCKCS